MHRTPQSVKIIDCAKFFLSSLVGSGKAALSNPGLPMSTEHSPTKILAGSTFAEPASGCLLEGMVHCEGIDRQRLFESGLTVEFACAERAQTQLFKQVLSKQLYQCP
jgi:hypothetical protein